MEPGLAPGWVESALPILLGAAVVLGLVWLGLALLDYFNRRAYNLTVADRTGNGGRQPDFLGVDHEKRAAAMEAGKAFDEKVAREEEAAASGGKSAARDYAGWGASIFAFLTLATAVIGAFARVEYYDTAVRQFSNFERLGQIIQTYWLGFIVVLLLIAIQIYTFIVTVRKP